MTTHFFNIAPKLTIEWIPKGIKPKNVYHILKGYGGLEGAEKKCICLRPPPIEEGCYQWLVALEFINQGQCAKASFLNQALLVRGKIQPPRPKMNGMVKPFTDFSGLSTRDKFSSLSDNEINQK